MKDTITFLIGKEQRSFSVHKSLVYVHCRPLRAATENPWTENEKQCISLLEHGCETFSSFLEWVYRGKVDLPRGKFRFDDESPSDNENDDFWWAVGRLYVLSDYLDVQNLKKYLVDLVFRKGLAKQHFGATNFCGPPSGMTSHVYNNTTGSYPLRALLADWYVWNVGSELVGERGRRRKISSGNQRTRVPGRYLYCIHAKDVRKHQEG
jgi:BTB/POZ domain